ncbi:MAG: asparaginase [Pseudomonadota bacterium]
MERTVDARAKICVLAMGGTISMRSQPEGGVAPTDNAETLLAHLDFGRDVAVEYRDISLKPSASVDLYDVAELARLVQQFANAGTSGVVVTHGTDTLEETAFALQLMLGRTIPVVLTGAMYSADSADADGPSNLVDAVRVAAHSGARGRGVLIVFDKNIHSAVNVRKVHSTRASAFSSKPAAQSGFLTDGEVCFEQSSHQQLPSLAFGTKIPVVPILQAGLDLEVETISAFNRPSIDALVVAGVGGGHVSAKAALELEVLARAKPVVITSGVDAGPTLTNSYAYIGGDIDLGKRGLINGGRWRPKQARLIVQLAMSSGHSVMRALSA